MNDDSRAFWNKIFEFKSQAAQNIKNNYQLMKVQIENMKIKRYRYDKNMKFLKKKFQQWMNTKSIHSKSTASYKSNQNDVLKRFNRTIMIVMRTIFVANSNFFKKLWSLIYETMLYIINRVSTFENEKRISLRCFTEKNSDYFHMHALKCSVIFLISAETKFKFAKFENVETKDVFVEYENINYRIWANNQMYISKSVRFLENQITDDDMNDIDDQKLIINFMSKYDYFMISASVFDNEFRIRELESSVIESLHRTSAIESSHENERLHVDVTENKFNADRINVQTNTSDDIETITSVTTAKIKKKYSIICSRFRKKF